ncbi:MAG: hypothetical protein AAF465_11795 [Pseudomonadota bacterium]
MNASDSQQNVSTEERNRGRWSFIVLVVIFFAPLIAAWLMYFGVIDWKPEGIKANGELVDPPVPIDIVAPDYLVASQSDQLLRDTWTLVYVADECLEDCEASLVLIRQVRLSLGRYLDRISRTLIVTQTPPDVTRLAEAFPGMDIIHSDQMARQILDAASQEAGERIYLVDPLGNLTLMFARDSEPRPIYNDLKHLLKLSRIG